MASSSSAADAFPPDVLREILLRLPPQPSSLPRASLVCKRWRGIVTDSHFLRRYRARHRDGAPVLGVFCNVSAAPDYACRFIPPATRRPPDCVPASRLSPLPGRTVLGCFRGRAVLHDGSGRLLVWDPVSGDERCVAVPLARNCRSDFAAALLVDNEDKDGGSGDGDGSFRFRIAVAFARDGVAVGVVYSSATSAWSDQATATVSPRRPQVTYVPPPVHDWDKPGAVVGDAVYWLLKDDRLLRLDTDPAGERAAAMSVFPLKVPKVYGGNVRLTRTPDGALGFAAVMESRLHLWALETNGDHGGAGWMLPRTVPLDALLPKPLLPSTWRRGSHFGEVRSLSSVLAPDRHDDGESRPCAQVVGSDEEGTMVFLRRADGIFMLRLESTPQIKKIYRAADKQGSRVQRCVSIRKRFLLKPEFLFHLLSIDLLSRN